MFLPLSYINFFLVFYIMVFDVLIFLFYFIMQFYNSVFYSFYGIYFLKFVQIYISILIVKDKKLLGYFFIFRIKVLYFYNMQLFDMHPRKMLVLKKNWFF
jgi:hypothetical protein